eukprot:TRINITY_DN53932_c0_g1_i1.p2 TRINITY_DN53932_c0_g1~~TRINITY_DN53932_c0_g1_i1.p2  ORF type:complete len:321 (+),score=40.20 TRINITY_DN53932_c0_g1_i1:37-999(+)
MNPKSLFFLVVVLAFTAFFPWLMGKIILGLILFVIALRIGITLGGLGVKKPDVNALIFEVPKGTAELGSVDGAYNFRDLGGYVTKDGSKKVRKGLVFRSSDFSSLKEKGHQDLNDIGIKTVIDLRQTKEVNRQPNKLPDSIQQQHLPIYDDDKAKHKMMMFGTVFFARARIIKLFREMYTFFLDTKSDGFANTFRAIAEEEKLPLVFHCSAGKDRTGLVAAILLSLLGVPDDMIINEYSQTNKTFPTLFDWFTANGSMKKIGVPDEHAAWLFVANPVWIENALKHLQSEFGGAEEYLLSLGVTEAEVKSIREKLLVPHLE